MILDSNFLLFFFVQMKQFVMIIKRHAWISVFVYLLLVCNSVINHGLRDERGSRSSFEEEPEKQLGLLRSFVFVQNIVVVVALFSFFPKSLVILKLFGKGAEDTNEH